MRKMTKRAHIFIDAREALFTYCVVIATNEPWTMKFVVEVSGAERAGWNTFF